ncbi:MAG: DUF554 domain-containing protein [Tissierellia bacterium]|nr:DUF554 domain-containing protein [Tissierellia bacterium]
MKGNIVNALAIIIGSLVGMIAGRKISKELQDFLMGIQGVCVLFLGIQMGLQGQSSLILILSVIFGSAIGFMLQIEHRLNQFGEKLEKKFIKQKEGLSLSKGFIGASLLYCVGSMAIIGALQAGLLHQYDTLYAKSLLDGIISAVLVPALGPGVILASISVFIYQGSITLFSSFLEPLLTDIIMADLTGVGGILIMFIGLNLSGIKKIPIGNLLPAIVLPVILHMVGFHL